MGEKSMAFQNSLLRRSIGLVREEVTGSWKTASCRASLFILVTKEDQMGGASYRYKSQKTFDGKSEGKTGLPRVRPWLMWQDDIINTDHKNNVQYFGESGSGFLKIWVISRVAGRFLASREVR
jgi:hypothetical protein